MPSSPCHYICSRARKEVKQKSIRNTQIKLTEVLHTVWIHTTNTISLACQTHSPEINLYLYKHLKFHSNNCKATLIWSLKDLLIRQPYFDRNRKTNFFKCIFFYFFFFKFCTRLYINEMYSQHKTNIIEYQIMNW